MLGLWVMLQLLLTFHHQHKDLVILPRVGLGVDLQTPLVLLQCFAVLALVVFAISSDNGSSSSLFRLVMMRSSLFGFRGSEDWSRWCGKKCDSLPDLFRYDGKMRVGFDFALEDDFFEGEIDQFIGSHTHILINNNIQPGVIL